jgi:hypothetical protein
MKQTTLTPPAALVGTGIVSGICLFVILLAVLSTL